MKREQLLVNGLTYPYGVGVKPVFSWIPGDAERCKDACTDDYSAAAGQPGVYGRGQAAYRVIVCSDKELAEKGIGDLWDSGKVECENPYDVVYKGAPLASRTDYFWRVKVWEKCAESGCGRVQESAESGAGCGRVQTCEWSEIASFTTGICRQEEWQGMWIGAGDAVEKYTRKALILRKTFHAKDEIKNAKLFICGLGLFEAEVNGQKPDDSVLNCGNTQYTQSVPYRAFEVTSLVHEGDNAIAVELGNGFYNEHTGVWFWEKAKWRDNPKLLVNLDLHYADGSSETIITDTSWKLWVNGPTVENSIYLGDTYDANRRVEGYSQADFDDSDWLQAQPAEAPAGKLVCQTMPPVRRVAELAARSIVKLENVRTACAGDEADGVTESAGGDGADDVTVFAGGDGADDVTESAGGDGAIGATWIITAPEMLSGWARIRMKAAKGKKITITYGERLDEKGRVVTTGNGCGNCGEWWPVGIIQQDFYISDGTERFWEPKYSYKGYRYIQVDNYEGEMKAEDVILCCLANDMNVVSSFNCSDPDLEKLHIMMRRTLRNNFLWKPTDTPVWEKNGWLGDANVSLGSMFRQYDMRHMMKLFIDIMNDCFTEYGVIPCMVPTADWNVDSNQVVWNTIFVFATEYLYDYYGELEHARELYPRLKAYALNCIEDSRSCDWTWTDSQLSDWLAPMGDPDNDCITGDGAEGAGICGSVLVYKMLHSMERLAALAGHEQDIAVYREAEEKMYAAFQEKYYRPEVHLYDTGFWREYPGVHREKYRQTSNLLPLEADMVPEEHRAGVLERLVQDIREKGDHLDTGCVGTRIILPVLADNGHADLAWKVLKQDTYPGWGFLLANHADSMWESWETATRSQDHYFFGTCDEFFYSHISGIRDVKDGCRYVTIKPLFYKELAYAGAAVQTVRGELSCSWKWESEERTVDAETGKSAVLEACTEGAGGADVSGAVAGSVDVCGADACGVDVNGVEACGEDACGTDACGTDAGGAGAGRVRLEIKVPYGAEAEIILPAGNVEILKGRAGITVRKGESTCGEGKVCGEGEIKLSALSGEYVICLSM